MRLVRVAERDVGVKGEGEGNPPFSLGWRLEGEGGMTVFVPGHVVMDESGLVRGNPPSFVPHVDESKLISPPLLTSAPRLE